MPSPSGSGPMLGEGLGRIERVGPHQVERSEAARVVEREPPPRIGLDHHMVVRADRRRVDPPVARHAEMEDQRVAAVGLDQPVFGAARQAR